MSNNKTKFKAMIANTRLGWTGRVVICDNGKKSVTSTHYYRQSKLQALKDVQNILGYSIAI